MYRAGNRTDDDDDDDDDDLSSNMTKRVENKKEESKLLAIKYSRVQGLEILDQLKLPFEHSFMAIKTCEDGYSAIKAMNVRGAPAIAITAALAIAILSVSAEKVSFRRRYFKSDGLCTGKWLDRFVIACAASAARTRRTRPHSVETVL